jgi:hypothetical protein
MSDYTRKPKTPKGGWRQVAAGSYHTVALKADGSVACWGDNFYGQCNVPVGLGTVTAVAAGLYHTVALKQDGLVACWGYIRSIRDMPWDLSDEAWFDLVATYGDEFYFRRVIPDRIRRTEKYQDMMLLMKL